MVAFYNTYTRYSYYNNMHVHYQEFIAVNFLRGLVVIAISQLLDYAKNLTSYGTLLLEVGIPLAHVQCSHKLHVIQPSGTRRREKVGALYSAVSGLLAVISRAYPQFLSHAHR